MVSHVHVSTTNIKPELRLQPVSHCVRVLWILRSPIAIEEFFGSMSTFKYTITHTVWQRKPIKKLSCRTRGINSFGYAHVINRQYKWLLSRLSADKKHLHSVWSSSSIDVHRKHIYFTVHIVVNRFLFWLFSLFLVFAQAQNNACAQ